MTDDSNDEAGVRLGLRVDLLKEAGAASTTASTTDTGTTIGAFGGEPVAAGVAARTVSLFDRGGCDTATARASCSTQDSRCSHGVVGAQRRYATVHVHAVGLARIVVVFSSTLGLVARLGKVERENLVGQKRPGTGFGRGRNGSASTHWIRVTRYCTNGESSRPAYGCSLC